MQGQNPDWIPIRDAIVEMDGVHINEVEVTQEDMGSLVIGGGNHNQDLVVSLPIDDSEETSSVPLVDLSLTGPDVTVTVQTPTYYPARMAVPLPLVLHIVEQFYNTGTLPEKVSWES